MASNNDFLLLKVQINTVMHKSSLSQKLSQVQILRLQVGMNAYNASMIPSQSLQREIPKKYIIF